MPPVGATALTIAAGAREGTLAITGCSVLALQVPAKLDGTFFKIATSKDGSTTYFNQTQEVGGQYVVRHYIPKADEVGDVGYTIILGYPPVYDYIKIVCSMRQTYARTFYVLVDGSAGTTGSLTLYLGDKGTSTAIGSSTPGTLTDTGKAWTTNEWAGAVVTANSKTITVASNTATVLTGTAAWSASAPTSPVAYTLYFSYPVAYIENVASAQDEMPGIRTGRVRYDQTLGAYRFRIDRFDGPLGQRVIDMEADRQGYRVGSIGQTATGAAGYLTCPPAATSRVIPSPAIATARCMTPSSVALSSTIEDPDGDLYTYMAVGNELWRSCQGTIDFQLSGTANAAVTCTDTTLTDTRQNGLWAANQWVGHTVTCQALTLVVTSNTVTPFTLTGTGTWSGAGHPDDGLAWEMHNSVTSVVKYFAGGADTITDTTLVDNAPAWGSPAALPDWIDDEWIGAVATRSEKTLTVTTNDHDTLTGASWVGGKPTAGAYTVSMPVTQIGGICETIALHYPNPDTREAYRRLWVAGGTAKASGCLRFFDSLGGGWYRGDGTWANALDSAGNVVPADTVSTLRAWTVAPSFLSTTGALPFDALLFANIKGELFMAKPTGAGGAANCGIYGMPVKLYDTKSRIQFLSSEWYDPDVMGIFIISGGKLINLVFGTGTLKPRAMPEFPPLTCGCIWQRTPVVSDGGSVWRVVGDQVQWLGFLPPTFLGSLNLGAASNYRARIKFLCSAGDRLFAGVQIWDGTIEGSSVWSYEPNSQQWTALHTRSVTGSCDPLGGYYTNPFAIVNPSEKHFLVVYRRAAAGDDNTYMDSLHLPKGLIGEPLGDDEFAACDWYLPVFDGGDPFTTGTMLGYRIEAYISNTASSAAIYLADSQTDTTYSTALVTVGTMTGAADGSGMVVKEFLLNSGQGESFKVNSIYLSLAPSTDNTTGPELHAFEWIFNKQRPTRIQWQILLDTQKWMRDNSSTVSTFLTRLATNRDHNPQVYTTISNIMTAGYMSIKDFKLENPSDPSTAPVGYMRLILEEAVT